jgi:hypothetical protein
MKKIVILLVVTMTTVGVVAQEDVKPTPSAILTPEQKVFGLSKFWQEVNYNFVYLEKVDRRAWDSTYLALIPAVQKTANDWEYYRLLQRFCAMLNDGHTGINHPEITLTQTAPEREGEVFLPVRNRLFKEGRVYVEEIDDKIYVSQVNKRLSSTLPAGSVIVSVNGLPVEQYIKEYTLPYISESTDYMRRRRSVRNIVQGLIYGQQLTLGVCKPSGEMAEVTLTAGGDSFDFPEGYDDLYPKQAGTGGLSEFRWYDRTAYIALNSFGDPAIVDEFRAMLPELRRAGSLIIDIRNNGGGNSDNGAQILEYLTPDDKIEMGRSRTRLNVAVARAWGVYTPASDTVGKPWIGRNYLAARDRLYLDLDDNEWQVEVPREERVIVPTVVLMDNFTASAAEDFLIMVDGQEHITTLGRRSYGSTGQPLDVNLVGGISARICTKDDTYPDGRIFVGVGVVPDIEIPRPTLADLKAGCDEILEKALEFLGTKR